MKPEKIDELADLADPNQLWRRSFLEPMSADEHKQMMTGVLLRRHANHLRTLDRIREENRSLLITPLSPNSNAQMAVDTPEEHQRLRRDKQ